MKKKKNQMGQAARMKALVKETIIVVIIGVVLLITSMVSNFLMASDLRNQVDITKALEEYRLTSKEFTVDAQSYVVTGEEHFYEAYMQETNETKTREAAVATLKKLIPADEWKKFEEIQVIDDGMIPSEMAAFEAMKKGNEKAAKEAVFGDAYTDAVEQSDAMIAELIDEIEHRLESEETVMTIVQAVAQLLFVAAVVYILLNLFRTIRFAQNELLKPIVKVSKELENMAEGNFSGSTGIQPDETEVGRMIRAMRDMNDTNHGIISEVTSILEEMGNGNYVIEVNKDYVGEFGAIKEAFVVIRERMHETFQTLKEVSDQIDAGSEQLSGAAQDLAEGCTSQAAQISDIVEAIKKVANSMNENAKEAASTVEISTLAGQKLMQGNQKMDELKEAIAEISRCSEEIGTIISAIEDIATQTNLLSLNAAIEAARAGEAGKGFAVVAEQVKKLAEESATAAGQTTQLIETTISAVEKGIVIAEETAADMEEVMVGAKDATVKMSAIAEVLIKEASDIQEVNERVATISEVVSNNSASSEETAAVSEEQTAQVQTMVELMGQFQI